MTTGSEFLRLTSEPEVVAWSQLNMLALDISEPPTPLSTEETVSGGEHCIVTNVEDYSVEPTWLQDPWRVLN